jgi:hypothetical protein
MSAIGRAEPVAVYAKWYLPVKKCQSTGREALDRNRQRNSSDQNDPPTGARFDSETLASCGILKILYEAAMPRCVAMLFEVAILPLPK